MTIRYYSQTTGFLPFQPDLSPAADRSLSARCTREIETSSEVSEDETRRDAWLTLATAIAFGSFGLICFISAIVPFITTLSPHSQPVVPEQVNREDLSYLK